MIQLGAWSTRLGSVQMLHANGRVPICADWLDASALRLRFGAQTVMTGRLALRLAGFDAPVLAQESLTILIHRGSGRKGELLADDGRTIVLLQSWGRGMRPPGKTILRHGFVLRSPVDSMLDALVIEATGSESGSRVVSWKERSRTASELLDWALQRRLVTAQSFAEAIELRAKEQRLGTPLLRRLKVATQTNAHSEAERRLHQILHRMRLRGWVANHLWRCSNGDKLELDVAWPSARLCVEVDGKAYHSSASAFERDRVRQNLLMLDGWLVLRFTWAQITREPTTVTRTIRAALRADRACR